MFAAFFQCPCQFQAMPLFHHILSAGTQIRYPRFPLVMVPVLSRATICTLPALFQGYSGFKEDTIFGSHAIANHNRYRCGKSKCTRAADNQHGNTSCQREAHSLSGSSHTIVVTTAISDNHRYKYTGNFIRNFRNRRLLSAASLTI